MWFEQFSDYPRFSEEMLALKNAVFGLRHDNPVILHRRDIIERRGPFHVLRDEQTCQVFDEGLLSLASRRLYRMCAVVIDKKSHMPKKYRQLYHPYHYCLAALLERYAGWLEFQGFVGDLMAESRGRTEDRELQVAFDVLYKSGTRFHSGERFRQVLTSRRIKFRKKVDNVAGLQLADLLAAPAKREIVSKQRHVGFGGRLLSAARINFNRHEQTGRVEGYGKVYLK